MNKPKTFVPTVQERRLALSEKVPVWQNRTLAAHFSLQCKTYHNRPLLHMPNCTVTYGQMWQRAFELAKALLNLGVRRRDHVAILMANDPEFIALILAISLTGAVAVPLNTLLRGEELDYMIRQSDTNWLILHQHASGQNHAATIQPIVEKLATEDGSQLKAAICLPNGDEPIPGCYVAWSTFVAGAATVSDAAVIKRWRESEYPSEVAAIIYTSGSTGLPKGVMLTHDMMLRSGFATCLSRAYEDNRRIFAPLPFYHVYFLQEGLLAVSFVGGAMITCQSFAPLLSLQLMENYQANDFLAVPSMLVAILNHPELDKFNLQHLYALLCCAAPAPVPLWQRAVDMLGVTEIGTGCGGTEASSTTMLTEIGDPLEVISTRVGKIKLAGVAGSPEFDGASVQYKVIDADTGNDLPAGSVGELAVRGNVVTRGYYKKPAETAAAIDKDGWLRSGDLGRIDEHGYIQLLGRSKDLYKVSGETVAPKEVEDAISLHPAVAQAYIVGVPDALTTETGAAFIELKQQASCTKREILDWCKQRVARFKVPRYIWFVTADEWPLTGTGKIQKFKLREMAKARLAKKRTQA
ncbi:MAG TPA: class I adenylate-forming enzyme family protein [Bacilli bacterium]